MRSTSRYRRAVALFLSVSLVAGTFTPALAGDPVGTRQPALLLKYAAPDLPDAEARKVLDPLAGILGKELQVRWLPVPSETPRDGRAPGVPPVPDDTALRRIAGKLTRASRSMDKLETSEAARALEEAERECRSYRFTDATRPFLAEIFLRRSILRFWKGKTSEAEALAARARAMRPGFSPDPAMYSPQFLSLWEAAKRRPVPEAELLVQSLPSGAEIFIDGERQGVTPSRVRIRKYAPLRVRVSHPGYRDEERTGQWLPGDTEILEFTLSGDRVARLGDLLSRAPREKGAGTGPLLEELSKAAGTGRVAVLTLEKDGNGGGCLARLYGHRTGGRDLALLGEKVVAGGEEAAEVSGSWAANALAADGWPRAERVESPWYYSAWFWLGVASVAGLAVALGGGGGGDGGGGTGGGGTGGGGTGGATDGTVAVNF